MYSQMFCLNNWDVFHNPVEKDCSPGVDAAETVRFSWKVVEPQGQREHDVRVSRLTPWMASVGGPVMIGTVISLFVENSHLETRHQGVMFRSLRAFVRFTTALRYEPCTQFINVSQRALHIYFIDGCRRIKIERNNLLCEQAPTEVFRSIFAWLVTLNLYYNFPSLILTYV